MNYLSLTVRFLDDRYHGLVDRNGPPEWPPSPFRLLQALVAGVARRGELVKGLDTLENTEFTEIGKAIGWLQQLAPPLIIAPKSRCGRQITRFVPNNDGDKKFDRQERLTAKSTTPTLFFLEPDQKPEVHYVWDIRDCADVPANRIRDAARSLTALGWGIDMAFADADRADEAKLQSLKGVRWYPKSNVWRNEGMLRTPTYVRHEDGTTECTLCDLRHCHHTAMNRIEHGKPLKTADKPKVFDCVLYASVERPIGRPCVVFKLLDGKDDTYAYPQFKLIHIAGMVRHLAIERMKNNPPTELRSYSRETWIQSYVAGHQSPEDKAANTPHTQFSFVPLPSIGHVHTNPSVRRVMIVAPLGDEEWLDHLAQMLDGEPLEPLLDTEIPPGTHLERVSSRAKDGVRDAYLDASNIWASVTPVILPGHNDHKPDKTRKLIERALQQSGVEQSCEFEWSAFSHFPKSLPAHKYDRNKRRNGYIRPGHLLNQTAVHLKLRFNDELRVPGPLLVGSGRHCGFGLMASIDARIE